MVTVLSRMSPIVAKRTCSSAGSNTERSATSSEMTNRSFSSAIAAMPSSSFLDKTCPPRIVRRTAHDGARALRDARATNRVDVHYESILRYGSDHNARRSHIVRDGFVPRKNGSTTTPRRPPAPRAHRRLKCPVPAPRSRYTSPRSIPPILQSTQCARNIASTPRSTFRPRTGACTDSRARRHARHRSRRRRRRRDALTEIRPSLP